MKSKVSIFIVPSVIGLLSLRLWAAEPKRDVCSPNSYSELIKCIEAQSPEIKISEQQLQSVRHLEGVAEQWLNPELEAENLSKGRRQSETTASLLFTWRLGGKKEALINEARAEIEKAHLERDFKIQKVRLESMLSAYRLRHLKNEIALEHETGETFSKIIKQYQKRSGLSPEQNVSLAIFRMALSDHQLRLTKLNSEHERLVNQFKTLAHVEPSSLLKSLPNRRDSWPELESSAFQDSSLQMKQAMADLKIAKSQKAKAESDAWPDLKLGPSVRTSKEGDETNTFVGFGLQIPLPVFSQNRGAKAYQAQKVNEAELIFEQTQRQTAAVRSDLIYRYSQAVQSLKASLSQRELSEKHQEIERQFFKGVIPSSLVIEAHRQLFELEERRNALELEALEAYGQLLILQEQFAGVLL